MGYSAAQLWIDFSYKPPPADHPFPGALGYLSNNPDKNFKKPLIDVMLARGKRILLIWQEGKTGPQGGAARGVADAREANRQADVLGYPLWCPIIFATDFELMSVYRETVTSYYKAVVANSPRPVGVYGGYATVDVIGPYVAFWMQCKAWSYGKVHGRSVLLQENGAPNTGYPGVDENIVLRPDVLRGWGDTPGTSVKVSSAFDPPHRLQPIVAACPAPEGGVVLLGEDGSIYAYAGADFFLGANGQSWFAGRTAAGLDFVGDSAVRGAKGRWRVTATSGETYHLPT